MAAQIIPPALHLVAARVELAALAEQQLLLLVASVAITTLSLRKQQAVRLERRLVAQARQTAAAVAVDMVARVSMGQVVA